MDWLQGIGVLAFIVALALGWTWLSFRIARWIGRLVGSRLPITPRALALRRWIGWSKPLLLASGLGVIAGPISYIGGWGVEGVLSGADWVLYGVGCLLNLLVGLGRGTAQRLGVPDEPHEDVFRQEQAGYSVMSEEASRSERELYESGMPLATFGELLESIRTGAASVSVHQEIARQWAYSYVAPLSKLQRAFHYVLSLAPLWAGGLMCYLAWDSLGFGALWLLLVACLSAMINRPWRGTSLLGLSALVTIGAYFLGYPTVAWWSGTWLLIGFLYDGWHNWCSDRFNEYVVRNEENLADAYTKGYLAIDYRGA